MYIVKPKPFYIKEENINRFNSPFLTKNHKRLFFSPEAIKYEIEIAPRQNLAPLWCVLLL